MHQSVKPEVKYLLSMEKNIKHNFLKIETIKINKNNKITKMD